MVAQRVLDWLLEPAQPSVRYRALTELLHRSAKDREVREAKARIPEQGWAAEILSRREPGGWWVHSKSLYTPKYLSTNWNLLALADLGATRDLPPIRVSCELWMERSPLNGGGVGGFSNGKGHLCYTGNMARALVQFGYGEDPRVRKAFEWLARTADVKGGWSCWNMSDQPSRGRNLDSWEALSAFSVYPRSRWTPEMKRAVELGVEFFLQRELHLQGDRYKPWYRFHWPSHYYYDVLVGLDVLTALGVTDDPRLKFALDLVRKKRRGDGRWVLDAAHPDVEGPIKRWIDAHPRQAPVPMRFEEVGAPSKMITLTALKVLDRVEH
ncbi:MAG: hypothetical protein KGJ23_07595 [Euryarchaeota archaeon]|nr:hypothetical protein [Euryarchaeota archaeon]